MELKKIQQKLIDIITTTIPDLEQGEKYGGVVFSLPGVTALCCGVYVYSEHVTLEFSKGAMLADPQKLLQGKGKNRRHLSFNTLSDINEKVVAEFLIQAYNL